TLRVAAGQEQLAEDFLGGGIGEYAHNMRLAQLCIAGVIRRNLEPNIAWGLLLARQRQAQQRNVGVEQRFRSPQPIDRPPLDLLGAAVEHEQGAVLGGGVEAFKGKAVDWLGRDIGAERPGLDRDGGLDALVADDLLRLRGLAQEEPLVLRSPGNE